MARSRHIVGADVMEVNPLLDHEAMTSCAAAEVLSALVRARVPHSSFATDGALA
ncbi:MAG: arginase family protein [Luteibacter jiangsuensis]